MKKDFYVVLQDESEASFLLRKIEEGLGDKWADPITHPFESTRLVPWNVSHLSDYEALINERERIGLDAAMKRGFDIGFHSGKFSQAARKVEEARFTLELFPAALEVPNFPACRALFYGIQSSIYSARVALKKSCTLIGEDGDKWWKQKISDLKTNEPLFEALHIDYNRDKHGEASGLLIPKLMLFSHKDPRPDVISGEGVFMIENKGSIDARRVFYYAADASMEIRLDLIQLGISGGDAAAKSVPELLACQIGYFETLIKEARMKFEA